MEEPEKIVSQTELDDKAQKLVEDKDADSRLRVYIGPMEKALTAALLVWQAAKEKAKKPFVATERVKRLLAVHVAVNIVLNALLIFGLCGCRWPSRCIRRSKRNAAAAGSCRFGISP